MTESNATIGDGHDRRCEFVDLLNRYQSQIFNYIFCIVQSLPDAEDVFQETTLAMWDHFEEFESGSDFLAWASKFARYRALNFVRSRRKERLFFSEVLIGELAKNVLEVAEARDARLQALEFCREKLSDIDQKLLALCYGTCNTIGEAAEVLGRPLQSVYQSLWRIRRALHECIKRTLAEKERRQA